MIKKLSIGILLFIIKLIALLPFWILNGIAYGIYILLDKLVRYRKAIIIKNLQNSFPDLSQDEIRTIKTRFYRYFSRLFIENLKMFQLTPRHLEKYIHLKNSELLEEYFNEGKDVAVMAAHYGNWEWLLGIRKEILHHPIAIYKPLNNKYFNEFFKKHRSQYGVELANMREIPRVLMKHRASNTPTLTVFITDQSPVWEEIQYWTEFLGQQTPVYLGAEKLAKKLNMAVVYCRVAVEPKNFYSVEVIPIASDAMQVSEFEITERYLHLLGEDISKAPQYWLWSHRRWKLTEKRNKEEIEGIYRFAGQFRKK